MKTLPPLRVQIYRDGEPCGVEEFADPRERFCELFNAYGTTRAEPIVDAPIALERFAVVHADGRIVEAGMKESLARIRAESFNRDTPEAEQCRVVPIRMYLEGEPC